MPFLGVAKVLGLLAILVPGFPRLREWAYAGLVIDLTGATYSIMNSVGHHVGDWLFMAVPFLLATGSYIFYYKLLRESLARTSKSRHQFPEHQTEKRSLLTSGMA